jgi:hypothetical protein
MRLVRGGRRQVRPGWRVAALLAVTTLAALLAAPAATQAQVAPPSLTVNPTSGIIGTSITLTPSGMPTIPSAGPPIYCTINYLWSGKAWLNGKPGNAATKTKVPSFAAIAVDPITAQCINPNTGLLMATATSRFDVTGPATTTTTSTTTTTTIRTTTTTTKKGTTTTTQPGQTTTTGPGSSSTSSSSTSSTTPGQTTTTKPGETTTTTILPSPGDPIGATSTSYLKLNALAVSPGAAVVATGRGCDDGSPVTLTIGSQQVGQTTADSEGHFHAPLHLGSLPVGRYDVQAQCGAVLTAALDVVLASKVDDGTSTTLVIIVFFVLIGLVAFRRRLFPAKPPSTT